jgi:predicted molibdopterin-dependent oxidoreductase YjgC
VPLWQKKSEVKMPNIKIDGIDFEAPEGWTILEVAKFLGLEIPKILRFGNTYTVL